MKPFKLIHGNSNNISKFEDDIAQAMEDGYDFNGEMIAKLVENGSKSEVLFFQPMTIEEHLDFEDEDYLDNESEDEGERP